MEWRAPDDQTLAGSNTEPTIHGPSPTPETAHATYLVCLACSRIHPLGSANPREPPACPSCGGTLRPAMMAAPLAGPLPVTPPSSRAEGTAFGRYLLRRELGRGGMGIVHEAWDTQLGRAVALKMLSSRGGEMDEKASARLLREARSAARLHHPSIVAIHDVGEIEGRPYFTMDLVEGKSLEDLLSGDASWTTFPMRRRVEALAQVAEALGYAHEQGIVHRDVKASNVMIDARGRAMLMDFGLAKEQSSAALGRELTVSGALLGTPKYMSPEQCGAGGAEVGPRSDVFSFGVLLYRATTGALPFAGDGLEAILHTLSSEPDPPSRVNPRVHRDLETITLRCLEKDPARRFADGAELAAELRRYLDGEPILSRPISFAARLARRAAKRRAVIALAASAVILSLALWYALSDRGVKARAAAKAEHERKAAEDQKRAQSEAMSLVERARAALSQAELVLYDKEASYEDLVERVDASQGLLDQAVRTAPDLALPRYLLGRAWEVKGWDDKAEACWKEALARDPRFGPAHYALGKLYLVRAFCGTLGGGRKGQDFHAPEALEWSKAAEGEFQAALASGSGFDDALQRDLASAMSAYVSGDHAGAKATCEKSLEAHAHDAGREELLWLLGMTREGPEVFAALNQAIALRPKFPVALLVRGVVHRQSGQPAEAIADFTEALRSSPRFAMALNSRGYVRFTSGDAAGAEADFDAAIAIDPRFAMALVNRAYFKRCGGDIDGALADLNVAIEASPRCVKPLVDRAMAWRAKGELDKALANIAAALALDPSDPEALANRANIRHARGQTKEAAADCEAALKEDPRNDTALIVRARIEVERGEVDAALGDLARAIEAAPSNASPYAERGSLWAKRGEAAKASADYEKAIQLDPRNEHGWWGRGTMKALAGDIPGAMKDLDEAIRLNPRHAPSLANRGLLRVLGGDAAGGMKDLDAAVAAEPGFADGWRNRGASRQQLGDTKGALSDYDECLKVNPRHADVLLRRGVLRVQVGEYDGGIADMDVLLALDPRNMMGLVNRGLGRVGKGDLRGALAEFDAALAIDPNCADALGNRGGVCLALGDTEGARKAFEAALAKAPRDWPARSKIEQALKQLQGR